MKSNEINIIKCPICGDLISKETMKYHIGQVARFDEAHQMYQKKCSKCDDRGHITDTPFPSYTGHSCDCAWSVYRTKNLGLGKFI